MPVHDVRRTTLARGALTTKPDLDPAPNTSDSPNLILLVCSRVVGSWVSLVPTWYYVLLYCCCVYVPGFGSPELYLFLLLLFPVCAAWPTSFADMVRMLQCSMTWLLSSYNLIFNNVGGPIKVPVRISKLQVLP